MAKAVVDTFPVLLNKDTPNGYVSAFCLDYISNIILLNIFYDQVYLDLVSWLTSLVFSFSVGL